MKIQIDQIKQNPNNPRKIDKNKIAQLKKSLQDFPEMLQIRPIVIDKDGFILGGNMRYLAAKELGWKEVDVEVFQSDDEKNYEFVIKDNLSYGDWNWTALAEDYKFDELSNWGIDAPSWYQDLEDSMSKDVKEIGEQETKPKQTEERIVTSKKALYLFYTRAQKEEMLEKINEIKKDSDLTNEQIFIDFLKKNI